MSWQDFNDIAMFGRTLGRLQPSLTDGTTGAPRFPWSSGDIRGLFPPSASGAIRRPRSPGSYQATGAPRSPKTCGNIKEFMFPSTIGEIRRPRSLEIYGAAGAPRSSPRAYDNSRVPVFPYGIREPRSPRAIGYTGELLRPQTSEKNESMSSERTKLMSTAQSSTPMQQMHSVKPTSVPSATLKSNNPAEKTDPKLNFDIFDRKTTTGHHTNIPAGKTSQQPSSNTRKCVHINDAKEVLTPKQVPRKERLSVQRAPPTTPTLKTTDTIINAKPTSPANNPPASWLSARLILGGMSQPLALDCEQKLVHTEGFSSVRDLAECPASMFHHAYLTTVGIVGLGTQQQVLRLHSELHAQYNQQKQTQQQQQQEQQSQSQSTKVPTTGVVIATSTNASTSTTTNTSSTTYGATTGTANTSTSTSTVCNKRARSENVDVQEYSDALAHAYVPAPPSKRLNS